MFWGYAALFLACIRRLVCWDEDAGVGFSDYLLLYLADDIYYYYYSGTLSKTFRKDRAVKLWPVGLVTVWLISCLADGLPTRGDDLIYAARCSCRLEPTPKGLFGPSRLGDLYIPKPPPCVVLRRKQLLGESAPEDAIASFRFPTERFNSSRPSKEICRLPRFGWARRLVWCFWYVFSSFIPRWPLGDILAWPSTKWSRDCYGLLVFSER